MIFEIREMNHVLWTAWQLHLSSVYPFGTRSVFYFKYYRVMHEMVKSYMLFEFLETLATVMLRVCNS